LATRLAGYRYGLAKGIFDLNGAAPAAVGRGELRRAGGTSFMSRSVVAEIGHDNVRFLSL